MTSRERDDQENRFTASLAGLAAALLLLIVGLFVLDKLAALSKLEDCLLQGRKNCERIELSPVRNDDRAQPAGVRRGSTTWPGQFSDTMR